MVEAIEPLLGNIDTAGYSRSTMVSKAVNRQIVAISTNESWFSKNWAPHMRVIFSFSSCTPHVKDHSTLSGKVCTGGTSAHLFDLSSSVVKAFQELVLNLTIYSTSSFTATGVIFMVVAVQVYG